MSAFAIWLQSSLKRLYPGSPALENPRLEMLAARNERLSFQACVHNSTTGIIMPRLTVSAPPELGVTVRRVGYVPLLHFNTITPEEELEGLGHVPGYVPDPLFPEDTATVGPLESHAFWITVTVPADVEPGVRELALRFSANGESLGELTASIDVRSLVSHMPQNLPVTHWFYADALCDWYHLQPFEERFWTIVRSYMEDNAQHGGSSQYVPLFTPPTDGVKRPTQLLRVTEPQPGRYAFDFTDVKRWTQLALSCGAQYLEWTHFFVQWGVKYAVRIYRDNADPTSLLWPPETGATSEIYRNFLAQFLPAFYAFLQEEKLLDRSFFHVSDEPHGDEHLLAYRKAREMLKELAPWMKVMDAMSDIRFGREHLTDIPIPVIGVAREYAAEGIPSWVYFCLVPRGKYLNRLLDTPLAKIRMTGWLLYRLAAQGFLHWGYNYWYKSQTQQMINPFLENACADWPSSAAGDPFVVYPGENGPLDSIRWEVFAESLRDYGLLQAAGIAREDPLLSPLKDYDDFPKDEAWLWEARKRILAAR